MTPATSPTTQPSPTTSSDEPEEVPVYSWEEAIDHISETATVIGPVVSAQEETYPGGVDLVTLMLGTEDTGGVLIQLLVDMESLPEGLYLGHTIAVTGYINEVTVLGGEIFGTRIWVDDLSQIEIVE
jgi:hypothetical protein